MPNNYYAVFDANNFYVSCERAFRPNLQNKPTVVVSSNGGGVILARSNEVKALGVQMAGATFKWLKFFEENGVVAIPANFSLYGEMSGRIASILHEQFAHVEEYSIDESFVLFPNVKDLEDIYKKCETVREQILKWTGVPVSVGIATTKTLSKVAVDYAKKSESGVVLISKEDDKGKWLKGFKPKDIWGIGWRLSEKLPAYSISDALDLSNMDPVLARKRFSVTVAYTINELNGIACIDESRSKKPVQSMMATGTFVTEITDKEELRKILKGFASRVGRRLRRHKEVATGMGMFVRGNRFKSSGRKLRRQSVAQFAPPTSYTPKFLDAIDDHIDELFYEGIHVKRAGVYLFDLLPEEQVQLELFENSVEDKKEKEKKIMGAIDSIVSSKSGSKITVSLM